MTTLGWSLSSGRLPLTISACRCAGPSAQLESSWVPHWLPAPGTSLAITQVIWEHPEVARQRKTWLLSPLIPWQWVASDKQQCDKAGSKKKMEVWYQNRSGYNKSDELSIFATILANAYWKWANGRAVWLSSDSWGRDAICSLKWHS